MSKKIVVLVNSAAKSHKTDFENFKRACEHISKILPSEVIYTADIDDCIGKLKEYSKNPDVLLAVAGGDGTLNLALNNISCDTDLGLIPTGTANVVAKELGLPRTIRDSFKLLLTGAVQKIDLGLCNDKKFAFVCGIGFDAVCANAVSKKMKTLIGQAAYGIAAIKTILTYKPANLSVKCEDGTVLEGDFAIFANMRRYGGNLFFAPDARYDDGLLNLVLLKKFSILSLLKLIKFAYGKGAFPVDLAYRVTGKKFSVTASAPTLFELDGEVFGPAREFDLAVCEQKQRIITT